MAETKAKICFVGCGYMGKQRIELLKEFHASDVEIVCVVETDPENAQWARDNIPNVAVVPTLSEATSLMPSFDGIWIATPTSAHYENITAASDLTKCIFCEKPIAPSEQEVLECYAKCQQKGVFLHNGWTQRFDPLYRELIDQMSSFTIEGAVITSKSVPICEPGEASWSIFRDFLAHEFNTVVWLSHGDLPLYITAQGLSSTGGPIFDQATVTILFADGRRFVIEGSRTPGDRYQSSVQLDTPTHSVERGRDQGTSFSERFALALQAETAHFVRVLGNPTEGEYTCPQHCAITSKLIDLAIHASITEKRVYLNPETSSRRMRLVQIGFGTFGSHMNEKAFQPWSHLVDIVEVIRKTTHSESEIDAILARPDIDAVYLCMPYGLHPSFTEKALMAGKHVLCEAPLMDFSHLMRLAKEKDCMLMIGYQKRFDPEFLRARAFLRHRVEACQLGGLVIDTREMCPLGDDYIEYIQTSCSHDIDLINYLFEGIDCEMKLREVVVHGPGSFSILITIWLPRIDRGIDATLLFSRGHSSTIQTVTIDEQTFGYENDDPLPYTCFNEAFRREVGWFVQLPLNAPGLGEFCSTYSRTYELLMATVAKVMDDTDFEARTRWVRSSIPHAPSGAPFGHVHGHKDILVKDGRIYKPMLYESTEYRAYRSVLEKVPSLAKFLPPLEGKVTFNHVTYLVLQDITHGRRNPRVFDIKVGEPSDFERMGHQPYGIKVHGYTGDKLTRRVFQSWNDITSCIKDFIKDRHAGFSYYECLPVWMEAIHELQEIFRTQTHFRFRASSLLLTFDAVDDAPQRPTVHLVDLAHLAPSENNSLDHMFCFGLENLHRLLNTVNEKFINRNAVFLVRHGFRYDYENLTWVPSSSYPHDPPLSGAGLQQAKDAAERLRCENVSVVISSPFLRAIQTAGEIATRLGVKLIIEPALCEYMSKNNRREVPDLDPGALVPISDLIDRHFIPEGSQMTLEDWEGMQKRCLRALKKLSKKFKRAVIVSHRSTFQALLSIILGQKKWKRQLQFGGITTLIQTPAGWQIERLDSHGHITAFTVSPEHNPNYATMAYKDMLYDEKGCLPSS